MVLEERLATFKTTDAETGKAFDSRIRAFYFGARWLDPELGLWLVPDPAGQFSSPYSYGGDLINYVDPYGLWRLGFGVVVGWNRRDGWSIGLGAAADDIDLGVVKLNTDVSYNWNQNGTQTATGQVGASACVGLCLGGTAGGSYNTESGYSASLSGNIGVGLTNYLQVGVEAVPISIGPRAATTSAETCMGEHMRTMQGFMQGPGILTDLGP